MKILFENPYVTSAVLMLLWAIPGVILGLMTNSYKKKMAIERAEFIEEKADRLEEEKVVSELVEETLRIRKILQPIALKFCEKGRATFYVPLNGGGSYIPCPNTRIGSLVREIWINLDHTSAAIKTIKSLEPEKLILATVEVLLEDNPEMADLARGIRKLVNAKKAADALKE